MIDCVNSFAHVLGKMPEIILFLFETRVLAKS